MYEIDNVIECMSPNVNKYIVIGHFVTFFARIAGYCCILSQNSALGPSDFPLSARSKITALTYRLLGFKGSDTLLYTDQPVVSSDFVEDITIGERVNQNGSDD